MIVSIHQPNFLPWLGFFAKLEAADQFVLLDNAQFQKTGGGWVNRVQIQVGGRASWLTVPIKRPPGVQLIREIEIQDAPRWSKKALRTLEQSYGRHPFFEQVFPLVESTLEHPSSDLAERNCHFILALAQKLEIDTSRLVLESNMPSSDLVATQRLVHMTRSLQGTMYLSGDGSAGYLDESLFHSGGIELAYMQFECVPYPQIGATGFLPGLSVLDPLFNLGFEGTTRLIQRADPAA